MAEAKKRTSTKGASATKKKRVPVNVDEYIAQIPDAARSHLIQLRKAIRSVVPAQATEVISYGIPAFAHEGMLVWYAAFSKHCSLFPTAAIVDQFKDELQDFRLSKGTIHFPLDKRLPAALIKKIVKARVKAKGAGSRR